MIINISLSASSTKNDVLKVIGGALMLGGQKGNVEVDQHKNFGWGLNWDALYDSLCYLESGGIWWTSPRISFPLTIRFLGYEDFKNKSPKDFEILQSILVDVTEHYKKLQKEFIVIFEPTTSDDYIQNSDTKNNESFEILYHAYHEAGQAVMSYLISVEGVAENLFLVQHSQEDRSEMSFFFDKVSLNSVNNWEKQTSSYRCIILSVKLA